MISKPSFISYTEIITKLHDDYGLRVTKLQFTPAGEASWCYIAETGRDTWFVKLAKSQLYQSSVTIPARLYHTMSYHFVVPALPTTTGQLWERLADHDLVVYPYLQGKTAFEMSLQDAQWENIGVMFAQLHQTKLDENSQKSMNIETFIPPHSAEAKSVIEYALVEDLKGIPRELANFIKSKEGEMRAIISRAEELGRAVQKQQPELVLCHADPNRANIFITNDGRILLLDWDGLMLAPRERDLTFFTDTDQKQFMQGYDPGHTFTPDMTAIAYYKYEWVVQEFSDYGTRIFFSDLDEVAKLYALQEFYKLFVPGDVIEEAYTFDPDINS